MENLDRKILEAFAIAIKEHEGFYPPSLRYPLGSRSWRNNSPGNLRSSPVQDGVRGGFAYFKTYDEGWEALILELKIKFSGKSRTRIGPDSTIGELFAVYAPKEDHNNPASYAAYVVHRINQILGASFTVNTLLKETMEFGKKKVLKILAVAFSGENIKVVTDSIKRAREELSSKLPFPIEIKEVSIPEVYIPIVLGTILSGEDYVHAPGKYLDIKTLRDILSPIYNGESVIWFFPRVPITTLALPEPLKQKGMICVIPYVKTSDVPATTTFILHETMHACYFIWNSYGYNLKDDVHSFTSETDPNPQLNLLRVLEKNYEQLDLLPLGYAEDQKLPVDIRYGEKQDLKREYAFLAKNLLYIKRTLKRAPTEREKNSLIYGFWAISEIQDPVNYGRWTKMTKPAWQKISIPPRPLGI